MEERGGGGLGSGVWGWDRARARPGQGGGFRQTRVRKSPRDPGTGPTGWAEAGGRDPAPILNSVVVHCKGVRRSYAYSIMHTIVQYASSMDTPLVVCIQL